MVELRPLALGEIIDRAATLWRAHWKVLFRLYLGFNLAQYALLKLFAVLQARYLPLGRGGARTLAALSEQPAEAARQMALSGGWGGATLLVYIFVSLVCGVAATHYLLPRVLGTDSSLGEAMARARARLGVTFGAFALTMGWAALVGLLLCLPSAALFGVAYLQQQSAVAVVLVVLGGLGLMLALLAWMLWFIVRVSVLCQVLAAEDVSSWQVFSRSNALTSGRIEPGFFGLVKVRLTVLITVVALILSLVGMVSGAPAVIISSIYGNLFDPAHANPDAIPPLLLVPAELFNVAVTSIVAPLYLAFQVIFYVDMRTRREGLDLELKLQAPA